MITDPHPARARALANFSHARRRAAERYGLDLTLDDLHALARLIRTHDRSVVPLGIRDDGRRPWVAVRIGQAWYPVVYDVATASVVTFPPPEVLDRYRRFLDGLAESQGVTP